MAPTLPSCYGDGDSSVDQVLDYIRQICDALRFAHAAGIVHRDIKPANILVDRTGRVKVGDFGLAKLTRANLASEHATTNVALGTPAYIAPEQWRGQPDHRADIYSLGVMFYEMLTGEVPRGSFDPPSKKAQVDAWLDPVVLRAMQQEPDRRYQQVAELRSDMDRVEGETAILDLVRNRRAIVGMAVGAMAVICLGVYFAAKARTASTGKPAAVSSIPRETTIWTNSLGMKFVSLGDGVERISVWETRISDFNEFAARSASRHPRGFTPSKLANG